MNFYISYFYKIRFMKPNMLPFSTAVSDPKWFHEGKGKFHTFLDKNKVLNGLRVFKLVPKQSCFSGNFLEKYSEQLKQLDFKELMTWFENFLEENEYPLDTTDIILIVYESPDNPFSERQSLINYFKENNITLKEFERG